MTTFGTLIVNFFRHYLANQNGYSKNTIASYSDCIRLLINYACETLGVSFDKLSIEAITDTLVLDFLDYLETERNNAPRTRNQRLMAIKTFFRFLALQDPELTETCDRICAIKAKRTEHNVIDSLELFEVQAFLEVPDTSTIWGARDSALLLLLYNTGARVQELADLKVKDLRLDAPLQVTITGKGKKQRIVPLWDETADAIRHYLALREAKGIESDKLLLNTRRENISRFGINHIIDKYRKLAQKKCPSLASKKITPHTFRHTTALHLIQSGVDITVVAEWLGHVDIKTTHLYANINIEMKRKALEKCKAPNVDKSMKSKIEPQWQDPDILNYLDNIVTTGCIMLSNLLSNMLFLSKNPACLGQYSCL